MTLNIIDITTSNLISNDNNYPINGNNSSTYASISTREQLYTNGEDRQKILLINGVSKDSIEVVSYGEENQAVDGTNEDTHSLNRRVEIVFSNTGK